MTFDNRPWNKIYNKIGDIGKGGNGNVIRVKDKIEKKEYALKILRKTNQPVRKTRFLNEIRVMAENCEQIVGILPIIKFSETHIWYTMPIAEPILSHIRNNSSDIESIIRGVIDLAETLDKLHDKGISHRDIKPANIYYYNRRYYLGDFGIASILNEDEHKTRNDRGLGAIFTIAPEMKRNPRDADGKKADVFSLAKTLWMLLTQNDKGFDGVYNFLDETQGLRFYDNLKDVHIVEIEELLVRATQNDPIKRPTMNQFIIQLQIWLNTYNNLDKSQLSEWNFLNKMLFRDEKYIPNTCIWQGVYKIKDVLKLITSCRSFKHMMLPDGGGEDLTDVNVANEEGCLYLYAGDFCNIVKPKKLIYVRFPNNPFFNYFLLEVETIRPIISEKSISYEHLTEDKPSHYVDSRYFQYGVYDYDTGEKLPKGAKLVNRYYKGKFLIVPKRGYYNLISSTYDGRHNKMSAESFENYQSIQSDIVLCLNEKGYTKEEICEFLNQSNVNQSTESTTFSYNSPTDYILNHYHKWSFKNVLNAENADGFALFYITFDKSFGHMSISFTEENLFLENETYYLCKDGKLKNLSQENLLEVYYTSSREKIVEIYQKCMEIINSICVENKYDAPKERVLDIEFQQSKQPKHLFNKNELKTLMTNADDRKNNMLVIDEEGYVLIIQDISKGKTYPVRLEAFMSGNNYVGKYSSLSALDDSYTELLYGWLNYLKTKRSQFVEFPIGDSAENLIKKIKKYYNT